MLRNLVLARWLVQVMVPMTSKAFMRGHLVHTNELLVLLGDNWFMEASAKRAAEVASRRLRECDNILEKVSEKIMDPLSSIMIRSLPSWRRS